MEVYDRFQNITMGFNYSVQLLEWYFMIVQLPQLTRRLAPDDKFRDR
jgi:hypothetical protein